jgi:3-oxoacyl-[acyl-carrier-protein] synthase-3
MTADQICPNAAPVIAHALGAHNAGAVDIGAACAGWLSGLRLAAGQVESGRSERVLLIGADRLSAITDPDDRATAALFADGAGAVVIEAGGEDGEPAYPIGPILLAADGGLGDRITAGYDDRFLRMDGHSTYQTAVQRLTEATQTAVERAGIGFDEIDLFVYHQANGRILRAVGQRLGLPEEKVGRLRIGQRVLVAAIGGGFVWGAGIVDWGIG